MSLFRVWSGLLLGLCLLILAVPLLDTPLGTSFVHPRFAVSTSVLDFSAPNPAPPSSKHILGTGPLGEDILAWTLSGARTSVVFALPILGFVTFLGLALGIISGVHRGPLASSIAGIRN